MTRAERNRARPDPVSSGQSGSAHRQIGRPLRLARVIAPCPIHLKGGELSAVVSRDPSGTSAPAEPVVTGRITRTPQPDTSCAPAQRGQVVAKARRTD